MTSAAVMTYDSLVSDIKVYSERSGDATFVSDIPRFIMFAENRIASEARGLGFLVSITGDLVQGYPDGQSLEKPARWRETVSLNIGTGASYTTRTFLYERSYEYCRAYWPTPSSTDTPKYYCDWDYTHFLIVPTPDYTYPYELIYHERPQPLDSDNSTNWTTEYAPQLLLGACMLEVAPYVKRPDFIQTWTQYYDRALKQVEYESRRRIMDRTNAGANAAT